MPPVAALDKSKRWAERMRTYLQAIPPNAEGWRHFGAVADLVVALGEPRSGAKRQHAGVMFRQSELAGHWELLRVDGRPVAVRWTKPLEVKLGGDKRQPKPEAVAAALAPRPEVSPSLGIIPDTPHLAKLAEARKLAPEHAWLRVAIPEEEHEALHTEAVKLYWWVRAGKP